MRLPAAGSSGLLTAGSSSAGHQIKEQLISADPSLAAYFRWRNNTLPAAFKWRSFGFLQAISVALLSGLAVGAAVAFAALAGGAGDVPWWASLGAAVLAAGGILWLGYIRPLSNAPPIAAGPQPQADEGAN